MTYYALFKSVENGHPEFIGMFETEGVAKEFGNSVYNVQFYASPIELNQPLVGYPEFEPIQERLRKEKYNIVSE